MSEPVDAVLARVPSLHVTFAFASVESGVEALCAELRALGVEFEIPPDLPQLVEDLHLRGVHELTSKDARDKVVHRLMTAANSALEARGDPRRLRAVLAFHGNVLDETRWVLVTPQESRALRRRGITLDDQAGRHVVLNLATLAVALVFWGLVALGILRGGTGYWVGAAVTYVAWFIARRLVRRLASKPATY